MNLLIGGTGFIGSALAQKLVQKNEKVVAVGRTGKGDLNGVEYVGVDLQTETIPPRIHDQAENVFILIGQTGPNFEADQEKRMMEKVLGFLTNGQQRIFLFSSVLVYGITPAPANEQTTPHPVGEYPKFKLISEKIARDLIPAKRLTILRLANVYGSPRNRGFIGLAMKKVMNLADRTPLILNGNGKARRDYIFIDDVAAAVIAVKEKSGSFGVVNVATGKSYSLEEVVKMLTQVAGQKIPYQLSETRPEEAETVIVSNRRLKDDFGYNHFTPLNEGLRKTIARYRKKP